MIGGKETRATINVAVLVLSNDVDGIGAIELIKFQPVLRLKLPAECFDKHLVPVAGNLME